MRPAKLLRVKLVTVSIALYAAFVGMARAQAPLNVVKPPTGITTLGGKPPSTPKPPVARSQQHQPAAQARSKAGWGERNTIHPHPASAILRVDAIHIHPANDERKGISLSHRCWREAT
jgi:hypothetical protein